jgi:hypothetical protein
VTGQIIDKNAGRTGLELAKVPEMRRFRAQQVGVAA